MKKHLITCPKCGRDFLVSSIEWVSLKCEGLAEHGVSGCGALSRRDEWRPTRDFKLERQDPSEEWLWDSWWGGKR